MTQLKQVTKFGFKTLLLILLFVFIVASPAFSQKVASISLLSSHSQVTPGSSFWAGISINLEKGWHTYSDPAGDVGKPPKINWELPKGFSAGPIKYPPAKTIKTPPFVSYGYTDQVILPILIQTQNNLVNQSKKLKGEISYLVCKEVCFVEKKSFSIPISIGNTTRVNESELKQIYASLELTKQAHFPLSFLTLASLVFFAFIGGLILNLMPCVLPVIGIKVLSISKKKDTLSIKHGLLFTLGVCSSMWVLVGLIYALKQTGLSLGWGFQLQSPAFITALICLFFIISLNLFSLFEIGLNTTALGQVRNDQNGYKSTFITGSLTTLAATPCSAPFMGTAVGVALTQSIWVSFLIFTSLALGIALPYVLITIFPKSVQLLPKPGYWMLIFKQLLGFLMLGSVLWLLWVLSSQTNLMNIFQVLIGLLIISSLLWSYGKTQRFSSLLTTIIQLFILLITSITIIHLIINISHAPSSHVDIQWEPFSRQKMMTYQENNQAFFINFTAKWCLTCRLNDISTLQKPDVLSLFKKHNIKLIKADWTSQDQEITNVLAQFNRQSVPTYIYFDGKNKPSVLPEILSPSLIKKRISKESN